MPTSRLPRSLVPGGWGVLILALLATARALGPGPHDASAGAGACNTTTTSTSLKTSEETVLTEVPVRVDTYATRVVGTDVGGATAFDQSFPLAANAGAVQSAVTAARNALAAGVTSPLRTVVGPALTSSEALVGSDPVTVETGREATDVVTSATHIGPLCIGVGDLDVPNSAPCGPYCAGTGPCASTNVPPVGTPKCIPAGGIDIETLVDHHTTIHATRTTTDTYLTTAELRLRVGELDPFTVYAAKSAIKMKAFGPVTLTDAIRAADFDVKGVAALALPAAIFAAAADDASTDLVRYTVKPRKGTPKLAPLTLALINGCGPASFVLRKPESLLVPVRTDPAVSPPAPDPNASAVDPFLCYKAKGPKLAKGAQVEAADAFETRRFDLKKVARVCLPAATSGTPTGGTLVPATVRLPGARLVCYQAKVAKKTIAQAACAPAQPGDKGTPLAQPKHVPRTGVHATGGLGAALVGTVREAEVCLPSVAAAP